MGQNCAACTIIAKNYFAAARTLAKSFLDRHPGYKFYVLVVDEYEDYIDASRERFEIVSLAQLDIPDLRRFCFKYNIVELCTAAKARFLEYLISERALDKLLYIDPDVLVTDTLDGIYSRLESHDIVLTPHIEVDYPDDGQLPDDRVVMSHGVFNLGFIGVNASANVQAFLSWWKDKLYDKCVADVKTGYFVDQKFIDLVPGLFSNCHVERDPGYNVAWWNLHSRFINFENGSWKCNGGPLYFFHFSNYRPEQPQRISRFTTRYTLATRGDLQSLFEEYRRLLLANGYDQSSTWPYTYDYFTSGEKIPGEFKVIYRQSLEYMRQFGDPFASPVVRRKLAFISRLSEGKPFAGPLLFAYRIGSPLLRIYRRLRGPAQPVPRDAA